MVATPQVTERYIAVSKVRAIVRAEIKRWTDTVLEPAIGQAIGDVVRECERRCTEKFEAAMKEFAYKGAWEQVKQYRAGNFVSFASGIWHCNSDTREKPGTNGDWALAVPKARDGRDYTPPPPAPPGGPRSVRSQR